jgi:anti-anti-sigma factor
MAFTTTLEMGRNTLAKIVLSGELDGSSAPAFKAEVEKAAAQQPKRLVLLMDQLDYMSSAGLRVLIFAKQKMGPTVDIYIVGAHALVKETIEKTGFQHSVVMLDRYDAAAIENI